MTNRSRFAMLAATVLLFAGADVYACGDKFLRLGRLLRLAHSAYPSSILIYTGTDAGAVSAAKQLKLGATLKQAGHKVTEIKKDSEFATALKGGSYELFVGSVSSVGAFQGAQGSTARARLVPLLHKPTPEEQARVEQTYGAVLTSVATSQELVAKLDAIIALGRAPKSTR